MSPYSKKIYNKKDSTPDPDGTAKAFGRELDMSPKHAVEVCRFIRGKKVSVAEDLLKKVVEKEVAVPFLRYKHSISHRRGKLGPGKYPVKTAKHLLKLLHDVKANAEVKGIDPENTYVYHISAYKGRFTESYFYRARGRTTPKKRVSVNIELIIKEKGDEI